jgi:uncharacterized UPF0160 family protein
MTLSKHKEKSMKRKSKSPKKWAGLYSSSFAFFSDIVGLAYCNKNGI